MELSPTQKIEATALTLANAHQKNSNAIIIAANSVVETPGYDTEEFLNNSDFENDEDEKIKYSNYKIFYDKISNELTITEYLTGEPPVVITKIEVQSLSDEGFMGAHDFSGIIKMKDFNVINQNVRGTISTGILSELEFIIEKGAKLSYRVRGI